MGTPTVEERRRVWGVFLSTYLGTNDKALIEKAEEQVAAFSCARLLMAALVLPDVVPPEEIEDLKAIVIDFHDKGLEPLCF